MAQRRAPATKTPVEPRRRPQQERSHEMVERILGSAQALAKEAGFKGLTTISIAGRAGLSVGSLYQYYPNKEAILLDLARRWLSLFRGVVEQQAGRPPPRSWDEFRTAFRESQAAVATIYRENEGLLPVLDAMLANPELHRIYREHDAAIVGLHADWFQRVNPALDRSTAGRLGLIVLETGHACFTSAAAREAPMRDLVLADLETMYLALLRPYLGFG
jgi:AcrR family transcriptional regulator